MTRRFWLSRVAMRVVVQSLSHHFGPAHVPNTGSTRRCSPVLQRATLLAMDIVSHRELRNRSGEILRRVEAGETVQISNRGKVIALLTPLASRGLEALVSEGGARRATAPVSTLSGIRRAASARDTTEIIRDTRGSW